MSVLDCVEPLVGVGEMKEMVGGVVSWIITVRVVWFVLPSVWLV